MIARAAIMFAAACLVLAPLPAAAHRGHGVLSVVEIDAKTGGIRVSHRIPTHDVEPALAQIAPDAQTSLDDPEAVLETDAATLRGLVFGDVPLADARQRGAIRIEGNEAAAERFLRSFRRPAPRSA